MRTTFVVSSFLCSLIAFSCARTDPSTPVGKNGITSPSTIHQEVLINVPRQRVYEALTNPAVFAGFTGRTVKELNADVGGSFELFDGIILGRQIELIPGQRVIQAWREKDWPVGAYTIVQFELSDSGNATKLVFDQSGIAPENVEHLSIGWKENYWDPMAKYLEKK